MLNAECWMLRRPERPLNIQHLSFSIPPKPDDGAVAQLGEHLLCKQGVVGSIPISSTRALILRVSVSMPQNRPRESAVSIIQAMSSASIFAIEVP
jgi:hypothetical protein